MHGDYNELHDCTTKHASLWLAINRILTNSWYVAFIYKLKNHKHKCTVHLRWNNWLLQHLTEQLSLWSATNNTLTCTVFMQVACHLIYVCIYHGYIEECCTGSNNQAASDIIFVQNVNFIVCLQYIYHNWYNQLLHKKGF